MAQYVVKIEGRNDIPVPEDIAKDEQKLRRALSTVINGIADAEIKYGKELDGKIVIEVVKKAGTKGEAFLVSERALILAELAKSRGGRNPATQAYLEVLSLDVDFDPALVLEIGAQVDSALKAGEQQEEQIQVTLKALLKAAPTDSGFVVLGL